MYKITFLAGYSEGCVPNYKQVALFIDIVYVKTLIISVYEFSSLGYAFRESNIQPFSFTTG